MRHAAANAAVVGQQVPDDGSLEAERDGGHHDNGLHVRTEQAGQHHVDQAQRDGKGQLQAAKRLSHFLTLTQELDRNLRMLRLDLFVENRSHLAEDLLCLALFIVDFGENSDSPLLLAATDRSESLCLRQLGHLLEWYPAPLARHGRCRDPHRFQVVHVFPEGLRIPHHDPYVFPVPCDAAGFVAVECRPNVQPEC